MKKLLLITSLLLIFLVSGCNEKNVTDINEDTNKLKVYTTVYPLLYFTETIGGEYVDANTIYPNGADEHTYEPTQKEMMEIADADLFFYIGEGLEGFVDKAKEALNSEKVAFVATAEDIVLHENTDHDHETDHKEDADTDSHDADHDHEADHNHDADEDHDAESHEGHNHGDFDPHVWLDPLYAIELAQEITKTLSLKLPEQATYFETNLENLTSELEALNQEFATTLAAMPKKQFIVTHAAYGYWERYGIEQVSISGIDSSSEPSQKKLQEIIELANKTNTNYVFIEQNTSSKLTDIVKNEIKGESLLLHNLSVLTIDDQKNKETYFTLMRKNLTNLTTALQ